MTDALFKHPARYAIIALIVTVLFFLATRVASMLSYVLLPIVFIVSYIFIALYTHSVDKKDGYARDPVKIPDAGTCSVCSAANNKLLPIMDPKFNLREVAKHLILLEDHLFHEGKRCPDCILKHCYTIDAFLDEGLTLDKERKHADTTIETQNGFKYIAKEIEHAVKNGTLEENTCCDWAQKLRKLRKPLVQLTADMDLNY